MSTVRTTLKTIALVLGGFLLLGGVLAAAAPVGDLFESLLKRNLGIKDFSGVIPGHGGVLDRIDSLLLTAPVCYHFLRLLGW